MSLSLHVTLRDPRYFHRDFTPLEIAWRETNVGTGILNSVGNCFDTFVPPVRNNNECYTSDVAKVALGFITYFYRGKIRKASRVSEISWRSMIKNPVPFLYVTT